MGVSYSIGIERDDGYFAILATLNNNDDHLTPSDFEVLLRSLVEVFEDKTEERIVAYERYDTPDYINLEIGD